jgi:hypothetical protein
MKRVVSLELNELNVEFIREYVSQGKLPGFAKILREHQLVETVAESSHPYLEPWIQWPTVYTGKTFEQHGVFRLGDIVGSGNQQIWEELEKWGVSVGAVSPMNAENRCKHADFFVPDPWTATPVTGDLQLKKLASLVSAAVNGNATEHDGLNTAALGRRLAPLLFRYGLISSLGAYLRILWFAKKYKWAKAAFLDRFLADTFLKLREQNETQFASLFLNAGAHIQHHHMFEATVYAGDQSNPSWYSSAEQDKVDPLLFIYEVYDRILQDFMTLKDTRLLVSTGLSQKPNPRTIYQYRFNQHDRSLSKLGVEGHTVVPRMSRDFLLDFSDQVPAHKAAKHLESIFCQGEPLFTVEERDRSLFCQIGYFGRREGLKEVAIGDRLMDLSTEVSLVSIENGIHSAIGYHIDTAIAATDAVPERVSLAQVFDKMLSCFNCGPAPHENIAA